MNNILVEIYSENNRYIKFTSQRKLSDIVLHEFTTDNNSKSFIDENGSYIYRLPLLSYNAFIIRCIEKKFKNSMRLVCSLKHFLKQSALKMKSFGFYPKQYRWYRHV